MLIRSCSPLTSHITGSFKSALQVTRDVVLCSVFCLMFDVFFVQPHALQSVIVLIYYDTSTSPLNKVGLAVVMGASTACKDARACVCAHATVTQLHERLLFSV